MKKKIQKVSIKITKTQSYIFHNICFYQIRFLGKYAEQEVQFKLATEHNSLIDKCKPISTKLNEAFRRKKTIKYTNAIKIKNCINSSKH